MTKRRKWQKKEKIETQRETVRTCNLADLQRSVDRQTDRQMLLPEGP